MCDVCRKEFKGWCKSFTRTEATLSVLEGALLIIFIVSLTFLILHFIVCNKPSIYISPTTQRPSSPVTPVEPLSEPTSDATPIRPTSDATPIRPTSDESAEGRTVPPNVDCTWTSSKKTEAPTRYFERSSFDKTARNVSKGTTTSGTVTKEKISGTYSADRFTEIAHPEDESDGEDPSAADERFALALVKARPLGDLAFGCALTAVAERWALTAASCIEAIEEVDSLDSFVIMESRGALATGATHAVADVQIHPLYRGTDRSYDLAALESDGSLLRRGGAPAPLPEPLDSLLIPAGERLTILGYGNFRTVTDKVSGRRLRAVGVHLLPGAQCAAQEDEAWAPRHLWGGAAQGAGAGPGAAGAGGLCAGPLYARGTPCNFCAGTPLLGARRLLGVMAGGAPCGVACEPALYANVAAARDWLDSVIDED